MTVLINCKFNSIDFTHGLINPITKSTHKVSCGQDQAMRTNDPNHLKINGHDHIALMFCAKCAIKAELAPTTCTCVEYIYINFKNLST
jgi:hypothetical protein